MYASPDLAGWPQVIRAATVPSYYDDSLPWGEAAELEQPRYSSRQVERAGKLLRQRIEVVDTATLEAFQVAHNWRNAHVLPMRKLRNELSFKAKRVNPASVTAGRLKRMKSIRKKLSRSPRSLYQMQDIAGCRAILASIGDLDHVLASYADARHELITANDYIASPKVGGYRSHHRVYRFVGQDEEAVFRHQHIEIQIRTQLQHAWATAVEAVGLVRNEDLKAGEGDPDWLRFFELMASEFAVEEGCPLVPGVSEDSRQRRAEIIDLDDRLNAVVNLDSYLRIIDRTERVSASSGQIFMIQYDPVRAEVDVSSFSTYAAGAKRLEFEESQQRGGTDTVLVEVDRAADLRSAYPNYFLDVRMFLGRVRDVMEGRPRVYLAPAAPAPPAPPLPPPEGKRQWPKFNLDWWFDRRRS